MLREEHVLALRLYTTAAFESINQPLRALASGRRTTHTLPVTVALIQDAIKKLRAVNARASRDRISHRHDGHAHGHVPHGHPDHDGEDAGCVKDLWRGLKNVSLDDDDPFVLHGGTELAPLSTTKSIEVALGYSTSAHPVLLRVRTSTFMESGADLDFLSAFPDEDERLFPPGTFLETKGSPQRVEVTLGDGQKVTYTVLTVVPHIGS